MDKLEKEYFNLLEEYRCAPNLVGDRDSELIRMALEDGDNEIDEQTFFNVINHMAYQLMNLKATAWVKNQRIEELKQDLENQANHYQAMLDSKDELIKELRERARN